MKINSGKIVSASLSAEECKALEAWTRESTLSLSKTIRECIAFAIKNTTSDELAKARREPRKQRDAEIS